MECIAILKSVAILKKIVTLVLNKPRRNVDGQRNQCRIKKECHHAVKQRNATHGA